MRRAARRRHASKKKQGRLRWHAGRRKRGGHGRLLADAVWCPTAQIHIRAVRHALLEKFQKCFTLSDSVPR